MEATIRKWLRQQLLDAEEASRSWRLRAIQVEAELRALQADSPATADGEADAREGQEDMQVVLSQVLGLEKQRDSMDPWRAKLLEDVAAAKTEAEDLQRSLEELRARLPRAEREAARAGREAKALEEERAQAKAAHEARCAKAAQEIHQLLEDAGVRPGSGLLGLTQGEAALAAFDNSVEQLDGDVKESNEKREELQMRLEELRTSHVNNIEQAKRCAREVSGARQALQVRQSTITKLQGEVSRAKARADRKRKQLEAQLGQSQLELRDAQSRAEVAQEQLRKVKAQHSRQLRVVKNQTTSLTEEWDAHIRETEAAKKEMDELLQQELDLRSSEQRFLQQEEDVRIQAQEARECLQALEYQTEKLQDDREALLLAQRPLEEEHDLIQEQVKAIRGLSEADAKKSEEMRSEASVYREEIAAHRLEFAAQEEELETLASLEKQVAESREARDALKSERSRLEDASKALQQSLEQQLGELREARRRCLQLKASHDELVKLVPPASMRQVTLSTGAEQVLTRASRKAEQLHAAFEGQSSGRNTARRPRTSTAAAASPVASTASLGLQQKLTQMAENSLKEELQECRRSLLEHQQRVLEKARKRGEETQKLRSERRSLEEELFKVQEDVRATNCESKAAVAELERHLQELQQEAAKDVAKVDAEFSDLLQKQALERNALKEEVEDLKRKQATDRELAASNVRDREKAAEDLQELEQELAKLRVEEEELVHAHVTLKAGLLAQRRRARSVPGPGSPSSRTSSEARGSLPVDRPRPASVPANSPANSMEANSPRNSMCQEDGASAMSSSRRTSQVVTWQVLSPRSALRLNQPTMLHPSSQPCSVILSDSGSRISPDISPRMRAGPMASSLPLLHPGSAQPTAAQTQTFVASRSTGPASTLSVQPRGDKPVYTWPRQPHTVDTMDVRNWVSAG